MTPQEQAIADKQVINIHFTANGYIVGYPTERRVYVDENAMLRDLQDYIKEFRRTRPCRIGVPYCPAAVKSREGDL